MAKQVRRWCVAGGFALGCAWLGAVHARPVSPEPGAAPETEYQRLDAAGGRDGAVFSGRETAPAAGRPGASTTTPSGAEPSGIEPSDDRSATARSASAAASRWLLRWTVWLQDYLLTCGFLV